MIAVAAALLTVIDNAKQAPAPANDPHTESSSRSVAGSTAEQGEGGAQIDQAGGDPHDHAGQLLVGERLEAPRPVVDS